jgi:hypothetical protein
MALLDVSGELLCAVALLSDGADEAGAFAVELLLSIGAFDDELFAAVSLGGFTADLLVLAAISDFEAVVSLGSAEDVCVLLGRLQPATMNVAANTAAARIVARLRCMCVLLDSRWVNLRRASHRSMGPDSGNLRVTQFTVGGAQSVSACALYSCRTSTDLALQ